MPEIKHNFTRGRMNKDLDERLIPKGEYRDAMNIQVSTSDKPGITAHYDTHGGDAGSITNLLGNIDATYHVYDGSWHSLTLPTGAKCIGAISDEKSNTLYWFIKANTADGIIRRNNDTLQCEWVFVDQNLDTLKFPDKIITGINIIDDLLFWTDGVNEPRKINITRSISNTNPNGTVHTQFSTPDGSVDIKEEHITVIKKSPSNSPTLDLKTFRIENQVALGSGVDLSYTAVAVISDDPSQLSDDIIWVKPGGSSAGAYDPNNFSNITVGDKVRIQLLEDVFGNQDFELEWVPNIVGGGGSLTTNNNKPFKGQKVVLKEYSASGNVPPLPITDYRIKGVLTGWFNSDNPTLISDSSVWNSTDRAGKIIVEIEITNINGTPPVAELDSQLKYAVDLFDESEKLFEFKFPRFSCRYKYEDNEYSAFGPWSEVAFVAGSFDYHPKKGYNIGMTNKLSSCVIKDLITEDMPLDVKEIDILYKEEGSTAVYVVDTIKRDDKKHITIDGNDFNHWDLNYYEVKDETINKILPENQSLRPWDNVPLNALAQEITGNRIVYGNYTQGHDVKVNTWEGAPVVKAYKPNISISIVNLPQPSVVSAVRSIKSLREYQLGVLFVDRYGRETPILTNTASTFKLEKDKAATANRLKVTLETNNEPLTDSDLLYYKFFIKETSGEYYNMAMDRWYDAGDGNRWISFPSSDRNKVDIDTFLILKKAQESNELIAEPARYKILAIENEAPDFIKIDKRLVVSATHVAGTNDVFYSGLLNNPVFGSQTLTLNYDQGFWNSSGSWLHDLKDGELWVEFAIVGSGQESKRYRVSEITKTGTPEDYHIILNEPLGHDVDFIADDPTGLNVTGIADNAIIRFYHYKVENKAKYDGRFFVKIFSDDVFKRSFESDTIEGLQQYRVIDQRTQYALFSNHDDLHDEDQTGLDFGTDSYRSGFGKWAPYYRNYNKKDADYCWFGASQTMVSGNACDDANTYPIGRFGFEHAPWPQGVGVDHEGCGPDGFDPNAPFKMWPNMKYPGWWKEALRQTMRESQYLVPSQTNQVEWFYYQLIGNLSVSATGHGGSTNPGPWDFTRHIPNEVWAIDGGPYDGKQSGGGLIWDIDSTLSGTGHGITTWSSSWRMQLALGPIAPSNQANPWSGTGNSTNNFWGRDDQWEFWNIGHEQNANSQYNDQATVNWVQNYNVGRQFRWEDDPEKRIYTITEKTEWGSANYERVRTVGDPDMFSLSINKRKNWEIRMTPEAGWIPYDDTFGPISGGYQLDINAEIGPNTFTADNGAAGTLEDYCIYLESNAATCNNTLQQNVTIKPGMIVTQYNNGGSVLTFATIDDTTPVLQVKSVDKQATYTKVVLCGYVNALDETHCITPTDGQLVRFEQAKCNGYSPNSANRVSLHKSNDESADLLRAVGYSMQFVEVADFSEDLPDNPAIWETEPKKESGLDIYYEISGYNPWSLTPQTAPTTIPIGSKVELINGIGTLNSEVEVVSIDYTYFDDTLQREYLVIELSDQTSGLNGFPSANSKLKITKPNGVSFEVWVAFDVTSTWGDDTSDGDGNPGSSTNWEYLVALSTNTPTNYILNWSNCYSFLNGVESNRIRDNFNLPFVTNGVKVSTIFEDEISQEHRSSGLIYSGIYNSITGVNNLNQFIQAEKITKDINPIYGSIQKLHSRDTDLITLCEDKILKILANKDALYNADGNPNLVATNNVLGQSVPFVGEYGISNNPESFASESYRAYFADKVRGSIIRLSKDGLTAISDHGMKTWFREKLRLSNAPIIGSYDNKKNEYNVKISQSTPSTQVDVVTFREDVKGWVSFKSFVNMEYGISSNNEYFTFKNGKLYMHHIPGDTAPSGTVVAISAFLPESNTFYGNFTPSHVKVILNDFPGSVKSFKTINYEGSESQIAQIEAGVQTVNDLFGNSIASPYAGGWHDFLHYNDQPRNGWFVSNIKTNLHRGTLNEFIEKEGKYFNYIKGENYEDYFGNGNWQANLDAGNSNIQGLGRVAGGSVVQYVYGCMDPAAFNYDAGATINETSETDSSDPCVGTILGCTDPLAYNYGASANTDDGSCLYPGCTDDGVVSLEVLSTGTEVLPNDMSPYPGVAANNQDANANIACGPVAYEPYTGYGFASYNECCTYTFLGCMDSTMFNYDPLANTPDTCIPFVYGCMDPNADNYDSTANTEDSSCVYSGCIAPTADNYVTANPGQIAEGDGWDDLTNYTGAPHGDLLALIGDPSYIYHPYGTLPGSPFIGTNYGCPNWSFAPTIFGDNGQNPPQNGVGVLIPRMVETGYCTSEPWVDANWQQYVDGCDPTIPYQSIIPTTSIINTGGLTNDPGIFGNNPPNTDDGQGGVLPTWPDISYAMDINGNQIPFTHQWWNLDNSFNPLKHMVNPFPPCATQDDGSCEYTGCFDLLAVNYDPNTTIVDNATCLYCGDPASNVINNDGALYPDATPYQEGCIYCPGDNLSTVFSNWATSTSYSDGTYYAWEYNPTGSQIQISFDVSTITTPGFVYDPRVHNSNYDAATTTWPAFEGEDYWFRSYYRTSDTGSGAGVWIQNSSSFNALGYVDATHGTDNLGNTVYTMAHDVVGLTPDTDYDFKYEITCHPGGAATVVTENFNPTELMGLTTESGPTTGCRDALAVNYCDTCTVADNSVCFYDGCTISTSDTGEADGFYQGAAVPCTNGSDTYTGEAHHWCSIQAIAETHPGYPGNWQAHAGMWRLGDGPFANLPDNCCSFMDSNMNFLEFNGIQGQEGYYGCTDSTAVNYCSGCTYDIKEQIGVHWCEYDGCNYTTVGINPDVNNHCSDAVYDHLTQTYTSSGTAVTSVTYDGGTTYVDECIDGTGGNIGFLAENHDPKVNNHVESTYLCTFAGCSAPGCDIGYDWPDQQPTGADACEAFAGPAFASQLYGYPMDMAGTAAPSTTAVNIGGSGPGYLMGLNTGNFLPKGYNNDWNYAGNYDAGFWNTSDDSVPSLNSAQNLWWNNYQMAVMCHDANNCRPYRETCQNHHDTNGNLCTAACYDKDTLLPDPSLANSGTGSSHALLYPASEIPFNFDPVGCTSTTGPQKSAATGLDFEGAYHKFEWNLGETWGPGTNPRPTTFNNTDVIPVNEVYGPNASTNNYQLGYNGIAGIRLRGYNWINAGPTHFVYAPDGSYNLNHHQSAAVTWPAQYFGAGFFPTRYDAQGTGAGTTVQWGIYKMCQNGEEIKINEGPDAINLDGLKW
tara:strand:- start:1473 stop:11084 length:9612 start_codon:yes stop_codon:yes gene_type:complete